MGPVRLRSALDGVPTYVPGGRNVAAIAMSLASNENPYPPLPSVREAIAKRIGTINRYPDMAASELTSALAEHLEVPEECVVTGPGSVGVLSQIVTAACEPGAEAVFSWRSFEAYPIVTQVAAATPVPVPLQPDGRHDLPAMAAVVTARTGVVVVCSPNNPTGPVVHADELDSFLTKIPNDVVVVLDEAYIEFVRDTQAPQALAVWRRHPNVVVLRTFSKAYGLAGLRVGYAIAAPLVAAALRKTAVPFAVSSLAQVAAVASLQYRDELHERVELIVTERQRMSQVLQEQGWEIPSSEGNFFWFSLAEATEDFASLCQQNHVIVRPFAGEGMRVSVGDRTVNDRFLHLAREFRAAIPRANRVSLDKG
ncbi:MAG: histidinol-phosphate transaminase [Actinomycetota bacterium]